ncbi:MAG TPA: YHS domain-containing protein [Syntrophales bacterium]|nr:YHS domain-containing protein [Syntrophales bacterium]
MVRILVIGIVLILVYLLLKKFLFPPGRIDDRRRDERKIKGEDLVEDPHCHTYVPVSEAFRVKADGKTLYFCSEECYRKFREKGGHTPG